MNTLEDDIRAVLHSQANAMEVPEPHLSRFISLTRVLPQPRRRHLVPMKVTDVSLDTPANETQNRWRLLMAAAAVAVAIGIAGIALVNNGADDDQTPAATTVPTVAPTSTIAPPTTVATETVSWGVASANDIPVTFTVPEDWYGTEGWSAYSGPGMGGGAVVIFDSVSNIYTDGCSWALLDPPVGPTVDDLVEAWADVPELAATAAVDITVDGYRGKQIELTVPDYSQTRCREHSFGVYMPVGAVTYGPWEQVARPNERFQMWVLDVDGTRLLIAAGTFSSTSPQERANLEGVLASIEIG